jgi:hypothetical protein
VLRGVSFPFAPYDLIPFGVLNEFLSWQSLPVRLNNLQETVKFEHSPTESTQIEPSVRTYALYADLLNNIDEKVLEFLNQLLSEEAETKLTEMQRKLISGLMWIGEATKPDFLPARYLKLSTALEYLIGGATSGITATLAERVAFLVGRDKDERISIDQLIRSFYGKRSDLVHGRSVTIEMDDYLKFGAVIRNVAFELCKLIDNSPKLKTVKNLQKWVLDQRYNSHP